MVEIKPFKTERNITTLIEFGDDNIPISVLIETPNGRFVFNRLVNSQATAKIAAAPDDLIELICVFQPTTTYSTSAVCYTPDGRVEHVHG